ncbi:MAG: hypothetical protein ABSC25_03150 [Roseiarcus sp.]|jgi:hypothetical protein
MFSKRILAAWGIAGFVCAAIGAASLMTFPATVAAQLSPHQGKFLDAKPMGDNHFLADKPLGDNHFLDVKPLGDNHVL